jgi:hypothetical protein
MKKLLIIALLLIAVPSGAADWTLSWPAAPSAAGYEVNYKTLAANSYTVADVGNVLSWIVPITLVKGTRYEFFVKAYSPVPKSYGGDSDHVRWTYPRDPLIVELPEQTGTVILNLK